MSRFASLGLAGLLALAVAAPVAAAPPSVTNISGSVTVAQVDWAFDDGDTFTGGYLVAADDRKLGRILESFIYTETFVQCEGADTPDDPSDDRFDFRLVLAEGRGTPTTFDIGKSYGSARIAGTMTVVVDRFDGCTGDLTTEVLENVPASLEAVATSPTIRESGRGSFHIPGEYNARGTFRQTYRLGEGTAQIGGDAFSGAAVVGTVSWQEHVNGR